MFSIQKKSEAGFEKVILKDESTGNYATVLPACSAMLHEFVIEEGNQPVNVIDSYQTYQEFETELKEKGFKGCKLSPFVCRMTGAKYTFGGKEYQVQKSLPAKLALHGLLYDRAFAITSETANETGASVTMKYEYRAEDPGYPFNYDCVVMWKLETENKLTVVTECINRDKGLIPMQDGWHPYFTFGGTINDLQLEFQIRNMVEFNEELIPTKKLLPYSKFTTIEKLGDTFLDNCFVLDSQECQPLCVLRSPGKDLEIQFYPDTSYPYLQIYTPPHRKSIAIENVSGIPDAFNNGMGVITLEPEQSAVYKISYKIVSIK